MVSLMATVTLLMDCFLSSTISFSSYSVITDSSLCSVRTCCFIIFVFFICGCFICFLASIWYWRSLLSTKWIIPPLLVSRASWSNNWIDVLFSTILLGCKCVSLLNSGSKVLSQYVCWLSWMNSSMLVESLSSFEKSKTSSNYSSIEFSSKDGSFSETKLLVSRISSYCGRLSSICLFSTICDCDSC